jgi:tetratricopeptide (TPR) repeat protein
MDAWAAHSGLAIVGPSRGAVIADRWLDARAWWGTDDELADGALARAHELGASTCAVARQPGAACSLDDALEAPSQDGPAWEPSLWRRAELRGWRSGDPAWLVLAARAWLRGDAPSYTAAVRAHFSGDDLGATPSWAHPTLLRLRGGDAAAYRAALDDAVRDLLGIGRGARLVVAVELAQAGRSRAEIESALGDDHGTLADALLARLASGADQAPDLAHAAAARALRGHADPRASIDDIANIAAAYLRDPAAADRAADDWIAKDVDVAARAPIAAALFAAMGDPARARALWQRAADASPGELRVVRGLALAAAATDDPDAAMIFATNEAAASGDAAPALVEIARALAAHGRYDHALELVHLALQLVPRDDAAPLYDLAIAWSRAEGKDATELEAARAELPAAPTAAPEPPPGDLATEAALAADPRVPDDDAAAAWSAFTAAIRRAH